MPKTRWIRRQLSLLRPILNAASLQSVRLGHQAIGRLVPRFLAKQTRCQRMDLEHFRAAWVRPRDLRHRGTILYLHGGGYTCGDLEYAAGIGAVLASRLHCNFFCPAYRLAPEHRFPAALEDALASYRYLLRCGCSPAEIVVCGESAGGGLLFSLCVRLREEGLPLPAGLLAFSPWADLTASGFSYVENVRRDPTMTIKQLQFYAKSYADFYADPLVSPAFADLHGLPPTQIYVAENEIMRDDSRLLHEKLQACGVQSALFEEPNLWHAYPVYGLKNFRRDYAKMEAFLDAVLPQKAPLRWMRLDNVAKIYPAALRRNWSNVFRVSMTLSEPVQKEILQTALDITVRRFPSMAARLRRGLFWYYLEELAHAPDVREEGTYPLSVMTLSEIRTCALRVLCYENRIAVEVFHSVTDGKGAMVFLKTLCAEYLHQRHGMTVTPQHGVLDVYEAPRDTELVDSFLEHAGDVKMPRAESNAYQLRGAQYSDGYLTATTGMLDVHAALETAKSYGVTLTAFLCAVMMQAIANLQASHRPRHRRKPVKVFLPVDLRPFFGSESVRNFVLFITPEINPRMGDYDFAEICRSVHHQMGVELTQKRLQARITTNVKAETSRFLKAVPLFLKNLVMKTMYRIVGENKFCITLSNLGKNELPTEMKGYVTRMDFLPGIQSTQPYNCGVISYEDTLYINFVRATVEPSLERHFFAILQELGLEVTVESNSRYGKKETKKGGNV